MTARSGAPARHALGTRHHAHRVRNVGRVPGLEGISHEVGDPLIRRQVLG